MSTDSPEKAVHNPETRSLDDISIFQVLETLLHYKRLIIALVLVGAVLSGVVAKTRPVEAPLRQLVFSFYPGGSASYPPLVLSDQLRTKLVASGHNVTTARGANGIVVDIDRPDEQNTAIRVADALAATIDAYEATALAETRAIVSTGESNGTLEVLIGQMAYESGRRNGSIELISSYVVDGPSSARGLVTSLVSGAVLGAVGSVLLVALLIFVRNWRRYRNSRTIPTETP